MQIAADLGYWDKKLAIILKAAVPRSANKDKRYIILFDHIWQYTEDFYEQLHKDMPPTFEGFMLAKTLDLYELFDLGTPNSRQLAEVAWLIQDSIEQLKDLPPDFKEKKVVGEAKMTIDGTTVIAEMKE
jgi:hypothetical protein